VNTGAPWPTAEEAAGRVLEIQTKLHRWATDDPNRRFKDLDNLVRDPAFLMTAWVRVKGNRGGRSAGVDGRTARAIAARGGEGVFLAELRADLTARKFHPMPVRERMIPKPNGKRRRLGIPTVRDRVVQAAIKLVLEPIFEADFQPCSYGFRPRRRAQDAIADIHLHCIHGYEWVMEGDITACFDEISHSALTDRVRRRIGDRHVLDLVKAFLKAGILHEDGVAGDTITGTPQGGILSPLLANIALSVLDEHFAEAWVEDSHARARMRRRGQATYRLVRYADDFVVVVHGTRDHAEEVREEAATVLQSMGLRLSETKTRIAHIDEGLDFLGFRIKRSRQPGSERRYVYTYPSRDALMRVKSKVRALTRSNLSQPLPALLVKINAVLRGWTNYFRHAASSRTFAFLHQFVWRRVVSWLRRKHNKRNWKWLIRHYLPRWWPTEGAVSLFDPAKVPITRYRYRGKTIYTPWNPKAEGAE
jgi:RNA-directed DNA polymerase